MAQPITPDNLAQLLTSGPVDTELASILANALDFEQLCALADVLDAYAAAAPHLGQRPMANAHRLAGLRRCLTRAAVTAHPGCTCAHLDHTMADCLYPNGCTGCFCPDGHTPTPAAL